MQSRNDLWPLVAGALLGAAALYVYERQPAPAVSDKTDKNTPILKPLAPKAPANPRCPWCPGAGRLGVSGSVLCPCGCGCTMADCPCCGASQGAAPQLGGLASPDGAVQALPIPADYVWPRNISSRGLGCCTFRACDYAARIQHVAALVQLPEQMVQAGIPGGGWPEKLDAMIARFGGGASYWSDTSRSLDLLEAAVASGRVPCIDYTGRDPHYRGPIAHCVCVIACSREHGWIAIWDNNYPQLDQIVWMSVADFMRRWPGWCYGLFAQTPGAAPPEMPAADVDVEGEDAAVRRPIFGLDLSQTTRRRGDTIIDGRHGTITDVIARLGPAMAPIPIHVDHDVRMVDPSHVVLIAAAALAALIIYRHRPGGGG